MLRFTPLFRLINKGTGVFISKNNFFCNFSMGTFFKYFLLALIIAVSSCSKEDFMDMPAMSAEFLEKKSIADIRIHNDGVWFRSERPCDTCRVPIYSSYIPVISQLSRMKGTDFRFDESKNLMIPIADSRGNLYTATQNEILKINDIRNYTSVLKTGDFTFNQFVFDKKDGIWMGGNKGIAYWNGSKTTNYTSANSQIASDITHGMAADQAGNVWIALDFGKGLLKITDGKWETIPYDKIPGLGASSYLSKPLVDKNNRIWFTSFNSTNPTNVICFDGKKWITEFPGILKNGLLFVDSQGNIWRLNHIIDTSSTMKFTLQFLNNEAFENYDVSDINHLIISLDADRENVFLGTSAGLVVKYR